MHEKTLHNPRGAGRKPIVHSKEELERQPLIVVVCGMKGIGKTYQTVQEIDQYTRTNAQRKGRKGLILDFSEDDSYKKYKNVHPQYIKNLTEPRARKIVPYDMNGKQFTLDKMKQVAEYVIFNYKNGLLVLEDIDKYMHGSHGKSLIGALTTNRHAGLDIIITHQSISKISQTEWQNCAYMRLHRQLDDIERIKDRMPNYPLMKIALNVVDSKYFKAVDDWKQGLLKDDDYKAARSAFVHVNLLEFKIIGCTEEEFRGATMKFIRENPTILNRRIRVGDAQGNKIGREEAMKELYKEYVQYYDG